MLSRFGVAFAPEIWLIIIAGYLSTSDLNNLTRLSSYCLALFRPILYRNVDKLERRYDPIVAIILLSKNKELAKCVRSLSLKIYGGFRLCRGMVKVMPELVPACYLAALSNMGSLKTLHLSGSIFNNELEQNQFVARVREGKMPLDEFNFSVGSGQFKLPGSDLSLPRLTSFSWNETNPNQFTPMRSVLEASRETLESISLYFSIMKKENYVHLWKMRYPRLRSLTLKKGIFNVEDDTNTFATFVIAHGDTLEELDLAYGADIIGLGGSPALKMDSLPRLKALGGHIVVVKQMIGAKMDCLKTSLRKLNTGPCYEESHFFVKDFLDTIISSGYSKNPFGVLRELELYTSVKYGDEGGDEVLCGFIERVAEFCDQSLEVWRGPIYVKINAERLADSFARFKKLKVIHLQKKAIEGAKPESYALTLAEKCPQLREVVVMDFEIQHTSIPIVRNDTTPRIACQTEQF